MVRSLALHGRGASTIRTSRRPPAFLVPLRTASSLPDAHRTALANTNSNSEIDTEINMDTDTVVWTTDKVRSTFIDFFEQEPRSHTFQRSSACAPLNDPTLLFTNAGMNQFKPVFLGQVDPNSPLANVQRAVNSQKCIRAGGKHNDLEDVGRDTYHHTFFEMLGSWSFGDYFKKEAIDYAWQLLTEVYRLDPDRLYATYFQGDDALGLAPDFEARDLWLRYLPAARVIGCDVRDNFWEMGEVGPCGPCSEIHYDRIGNRDAAAFVNADDPQVIEIWNIVFIQYNREPDKLQTLPAKHIDTGMGLERLVSILQNKDSNYDIDVFQPLFAKLATHTDRGPYTGRVGTDDVDLKDTAYRAIADHARTLAFAIADGAVPNNEGRGYVLRRILRRATRYGQQILHCAPGFFATLIPVVVETFGETYPELRAAESTILEIVQEEEQAFGDMLDRGIKFFTELEGELKENKVLEISGEKAFFMYDTLGFPVDLTELMAQEAGLSVDMAGFANAMETQKTRSRQAQKTARAGNAPVLELVAEQTAWLVDQNVLPTDDGFKYKWDVQLPATVMALYGKDGFLTGDSTADQGDFVGIVLDKSSFYAEAGGQEADVGTLEFLDEAGTITGRFTVTDVQVYAGFLLHKGAVEEGSIAVDQAVNCKVDYERRRMIAPNHSMTHVLNAALRNVLGEKCDQRGSLCNNEKLRFDFAHKRAMTLLEIKAVEEFCQKSVADAQPVKSKVMSLADAQAIDGVRAVFGEVYPDPVRVIAIGDSSSVEFCGGTHLENTAEAEAFVLVEETAVAKGIRRVTAVTKDAAKRALAGGVKFQALVDKIEQLPATTSGLYKQAGSARKDLDAAFVSAVLKAELRTRLEAIQKKANDAAKKALQQRVDLVLNDVKKDVAVALEEKMQTLVLNVDIAADSKASQRVMNTVKEIAPEMAFLGVSEAESGSGGKIMAFAVVPDRLMEEFDLRADEWIRATLESCGGRGGGKPGSAQGQAQDCADVSAVVDAANAFASSKVQSKTL